jgi:hypothetical protein
MKQCAKCKNQFPATIEYFNKASNRPDGLYNYCISCSRDAAKRRYEKNKDNILAQQREYGALHREKKRAYGKQYYQENKEQLAVKNKEYRAQHKDELIQQRREYWERTKEERHKSQREQYLRNRDAIRAKTNRYYHANRETALAKQKEYAERNKEQVLASKRRYHQEHRDILLPKKRQRYLNDKTRINSKNRQWRKENRHKMKIYSHRRMARKLAFPDTFTIEQSAYCLEYWLNHCVYCGSDGELTLDHYIPLVSASCPGTVAANMLPACRSCNCSKQDSEPIEWLARRFGVDQAELIMEAIREYFASVDIVE